MTRDETWISHKDMLRKFAHIPAAIPNPQLRAQINQYFRRQLGPRPSAKQRRVAKQRTISRYPELIDRYIKMQEDDSDGAQAISAQRVADTRSVFIAQVQAAISALADTNEFYSKPKNSYTECLQRALWFKSA